MRKLKTKILLHIYLSLSKIIIKIRKKIMKLSTIELTVNDIKGEVQITNCYWGVKSLVKLTDGNVVPQKDSIYQYKHMFKYRGLDLFYLTRSEKEDPVTVEEIDEIIKSWGYDEK